ncbi:MAG: hypothetical protein PWP65_1872 [Clostridia bacterium]|nr:hypothetical protein [Clostridia bacterium]
MQVFFSREGDALLARIKGEIDMSVADALRRELEENIERTETNILFLDLSEVSFMDSSGLAVIMGRYRQMFCKKGQMVILRPQPQVERLLELSGLSRIIAIRSKGLED